MLLQDKLKYLYQTFLTNYLGHNDQPKEKLSACYYIHTVPYLLKNCSFSLFVVICRGVNLWLYQSSVLLQTSLHKNLTKPFWSLIWIYWTYHWVKMTNILYNINESPTPPAAPPNFSFMSSIQIVPDQGYMYYWVFAPKTRMNENLFWDYEFAMHKIGRFRALVDFGDGNIENW